MSSSQAVRLCPELILVPPNFALYKKESQAVRGVFHRFTDLVEPLSLDEAYLDVSESKEFNGSATLIAKEIRTLIEKETGLTASAGIAPNKFLAKIASDWNKPNGQFVVRPEEIEAFMPPLKIEKLYGVGKVTAKKMHDLALHTCGDIQKQPLAQLARWFGSRAQDLHDLSRGIDNRKVDPSSERKSLTVEETYNEDLHTLADCLARIPLLYQDWETRMLRTDEREKIRGFVVKLKFHDFKTTTHEISSRAWPMIHDFERLLTRAWERRSEPVRLIGIGVRMSGDESKESTSQLSFTLF
jgi:DNA polymerase-4